MSRKNSQPANFRPLLAYDNERFLTSAEARTIRILSEYLEPQVRLRKAGVQNTVVFFGSARVLPRDVAMETLRKVEQTNEGEAGPAFEALKAARMAVEMSRYYEEARKLSFLITRWSQQLNRGSGFLVVCSGGGPGIMEAANRGAAEAGGKSIGLNIKLPTEQSANPYITPELAFTFHYFFMRKLWFAQPAKALILFPGGFGTMDELWEFLTLLQTGKMRHRVGILLYSTTYWKKAINFEWMRETGTVTDEDLNLLHFVDTPEHAFSVLQEGLKRDRTMRSAFARRFF
jgi:uncharacterized protein (TIGR00730 family)